MALSPTAPPACAHPCEYNREKLMSAVNNPTTFSNLQSQDDKINQAVDTAKRYAPVAKEIFKGAKEVGKSLKDLQDTFYVN